jgi:hypothetical protein
MIFTKNNSWHLVTYAASLWRNMSTYKIQMISELGNSAIWIICSLRTQVTNNKTETRAELMSVMEASRTTNYVMLTALQFDILSWGALSVLEHHAVLDIPAATNRWQQLWAELTQRCLCTGSSGFFTTTFYLAGKFIVYIYICTGLCT